MRELGRYIKFRILVHIPLVTELLDIVHHIMYVQHCSLHKHIAQGKPGFSVTIHIGDSRYAFFVVLALLLCARHVPGQAPHVDVAEVAAHEEGILKSVADAQVRTQIAYTTIVL